MTEVQIDPNIGPDQVLDTSDPGDETQRNFRYQHGYGVILLIASLRGDQPYTTLWCENHDDYLCERVDGLFDSYQVKTRKPEAGPWTLFDEPLQKSIKRFHELNKQFPNKMGMFYFVSNVESLNVGSEIQDQNKLGRSPFKLLETIKITETADALKEPFSSAFECLLKQCNSTADELFPVLKRIRLIKGPGRDSFDAEIAHDHLPSLPSCSIFPPTTLNSIRDELIKKVYFASSLKVDNPNRHLPIEDVSRNPTLLSKKLTLEVVEQIIGSLPSLYPPTIIGSRVAGSHNNLSDRGVVFISHSSPDGDVFSRWLALKLIGLGYSVWCDLLNLKGGEEQVDEVQRAITEQSAIYLFVLTQNSNSNSQVLREFQIAYDHMREKNISGFIVPIEIENVPYENTNFLLRNIHRISFTDGWAKGLSILIERLETSNISKDPELDMSSVNVLWKSQYDPDKGVIYQPEVYQSNWFPIAGLPGYIYFHELQRNGIGALEIRTTLPYPGFQNNIYLVSFAKADDFMGHLDTYLSIKSSTQILTQNFLDGKYDHRFAKENLAWNFVTQLLDQGWEFFMQKCDLGNYQMANGRFAHYFHLGYGNKRISFTDSYGDKGSRSLVGYKTVSTSTGERKKKYWLFGIQGKVILYPVNAYIIKPHVVFSDDGHQIWSSKGRLHSARRSWCKDWWNEHWRDRILASMAILSNEDGVIYVPLGSDVGLEVSALPILFESPVSYTDPPKKSKRKISEASESVENDTEEEMTEEVVEDISDFDEDEYDE